MLSGAFGGYTGCISMSRTVLNFRGGGKGRLSGLTAAAISALMLSAGATARLHAEIRTRGLLIYLAADKFQDGSFYCAERLSVTEYLSLLAIIVIILQWGSVAGVG